MNGQWLIYSNNNMSFIIKDRGGLELLRRAYNKRAI